MLREGEWLSLNGSTGEVILGKQPLSPPALSGDLGTFMAWVDDVRKLKVKIPDIFQSFFFSSSNKLKGFPSAMTKLFAYVLLGPG